MAKKYLTRSHRRCGLKFEAALAELEKLVASMEAGQLPLEESLTAYRRGVLVASALPEPAC
jgi:exodeoxyribonuclease VII small subunit